MKDFVRAGSFFIRSIEDLIATYSLSEWQPILHTCFPNSAWVNVQTKNREAAIHAIFKGPRFLSSSDCPMLYGKSALNMRVRATTEEIHAIQCMPLACIWTGYPVCVVFESDQWQERFASYIESTRGCSKRREWKSLVMNAVFESRCEDFSSCKVLRFSSYSMKPFFQLFEIPCQVLASISNCDASLWSKAINQNWQCDLETTPRVGYDRNAFFDELFDAVCLGVVDRQKWKHIAYRLKESECEELTMQLGGCE